KRHWVLLALILLGLLFYVGPNPAKNRIAYTFTEKIDRGEVEILGAKLDKSTSARLKGWKDVMHDWIKHPFLGFGVTGYQFVDAQYFRVLIETGILGLLTFFLLISRIFIQTYHNLEKNIEPFERGLCMGFLAGFIGLLFHGIGANTFIIVRIMEPFWFVLAMVIMMPYLGGSEKAEI
ncbi:MAG: hypothetical protein GY864_01520, partial [Desulfobacterales bacterium]|nr:hypothetical protein [Desulfobacterales bacterium]